MPYKLCNFACECGEEYEDMIWKDHDAEEFDPQMDCPSCGVTNARCIAAAGIAAFSIMSREHQKAALQKRSIEHSKKEFKRNSDEMRAKMGIKD